MIDVFRYSAAHASIQADVGNLLSEPVWDRLLSAAGHEEQLSVLADGAYRGAASGEDSDGERFENRLRTEPARSFLLPLAFLRGSARTLVEWRLKKLEVENLVRVVRGIDHGIGGDRIFSSLFPLEDVSSVDWETLSHLPSISDLTDRLARNPDTEVFSRSLNRAGGQYDRKRSTAVLEIALAVDYYRRLHRLAGKLAGSDRKHASPLIESMIDARNLLWTLRGRFYFGLGPEAILGTTFPESDRVTGSLLQRAASDATVEEVVEDARQIDVPGRESIRGLSPQQAIKTLAVLFARRHYDHCQSLLAGNSPNLGSVLAYLEIRSLEVEDLIAVFEGGKYGWPEKKIRNRLCGAARRP